GINSKRDEPQAQQGGDQPAVPATDVGCEASMGLHSALLYHSSPRRSRPSYHAVETLRPMLTLVHALTDAALLCLRVWYINPVRHGGSTGARVCVRCPFQSPLPHQRLCPKTRCRALWLELDRRHRM